MRSAIFSRIALRSATDVVVHFGAARCAASMAESMSAALERGISQKSAPSTGDGLAK